ncbi:hypothetical protein [Tateyamaria sp. ANG-S1]|uniref:hypothetical protein n=1 Tax=Tateyamaria sp. ANG-S1 TaxID=1577905 RepID=UPI00057F355C|nr:hypothetical protein [Tateyamaria sp. ANG-S1]KIC48386.1 hypothetical protein RA29_11450 [Tateyamaria sp. ANG-S1]
MTYPNAQSGADTETAIVLAGALINDAAQRPLTRQNARDLHDAAAELAGLCERVSAGYDDLESELIRDAGLLTQLVEQPLNAASTASVTRLADTIAECAAVLA